MLTSAQPLKYEIYCELPRFQFRPPIETLTTSSSSCSVNETVTVAVAVTLPVCTLYVLAINRRGSTLTKGNEDLQKTNVVTMLINVCGWTLDTTTLTDCSHLQWVPGYTQRSVDTNAMRLCRSIWCRVWIFCHCCSRYGVGVIVGATIIVVIRSQVDTRFLRTHDVGTHGVLTTA